MNTRQTAIIGISLLIILAATASAKEESGGILDKITGVIKSIIEAVVNIIKSITGSKTTTTTTKVSTTQPSCSPPNIQVGKQCCLDQNKNGICDKDESTTTTTIETTTTTSVRTTTRATTEATMEETTTTTIIICRTNIDCGTSLQKRICYEKGIYEVTQIPICKNPGTSDSSCYIKQIGPSVQGQLVGKIEDCEFGCDSVTAVCRSG